MHINVNANLFRIAAMCQSNEQTRYYLCGVFIEPHVTGVTMTATNGHYLLSIHDETGSCSAPCIVALSKDALRACKTGKKEYVERRVVMADDNKAFVRGGELDCAVTPNAVVDGTFPDWRAVVRKAVPKEGAATFDHEIMRTLADVAHELDAKGFTMATSPTGAALVRFTTQPHAFALAMPMRNEELIELPAWYRAQILMAAA